MKTDRLGKGTSKRKRNSVPTDGRTANGRFAQGNAARLVHGRDSKAVKRALLEGMENIRAALREREAGVVADLGGADNISTIKRDLITRYLETSAIADYLGQNLAAEGVLTTKGKRRAAVAAYLSVVAQLQKLAQAIGLERKSKRVPNLDEFLAQRSKAKPEEKAHE